MAKTNPELEQALQNMETFKNLVSSKVTNPNMTKALLAFIGSVEGELITCPSSTRTEYQGAFPGGLVSHSIAVVKTMAALNKAYEANLTGESIVITGLFHDIGKIGNEEEAYYLNKESDWHNRQGIMYEVNSNLMNMPVSMRSLFLLQKHGILLSEEEHYAISSIRDRSRPGEESIPQGNEPMLALILQQAVRTTCLKGRGQTSLATRPNQTK